MPKIRRYINLSLTLKYKIFKSLILIAGRIESSIYPLYITEGVGEKPKLEFHVYKKTKGTLRRYPPFLTPTYQKTNFSLY